MGHEQFQDSEHMEIRLPSDDRAFEISGLKYHNGKLAIIKSRYKSYKEESECNDCSLYLYNIKEQNFEIIKEHFESRLVIKEQALCWNKDSKLALILWNEVVVIDIQNKLEEQHFPFDSPYSVEFSEDGSILAIGGDKAILYKVN
jgi:hypothetical protein